jgi:alkylhydroperoxidase family enzyme
MNTQFSQKLFDINDAVTKGPGESEAALRQDIVNYASALALGQPANSAPIPDNLLPYLNKVILHAYKTTDADIEHLKRAGYSEDDLFELTISAAFGAGYARYQRGLSLLK